MSGNHNHNVDEWVEKAEGDFRIACRESMVEVEQYYDLVCFHIQQ